MLDLGRLNARFRPKMGMTTLADGVTTIALTGYEHYKTSNTSAVVISNITGGYEGQTISIYPRDDYTTIAHNANIHLPNDVSRKLINGEVITLWYDGSVWVHKADTPYGTIHDVRRFGAIGDGVTDCTAAFNAALAACHNGGVMYIPSGTYIISSPITGFPIHTWSYMDGGIIIRGEGTGNTFLKYTGTSGYCIDISPTEADALAHGSCENIVIEHLHIQAPNIPHVDDGGGILSQGASDININNVVFTYHDSATAIYSRGRDVSVSENGMIHDVDRDFTTSGAGVSERFAIKFTTKIYAAYLRWVTVTLGKTGSPAGTIHAEIWTDVGGSPGVQVEFDSETIACDALSAVADGAVQKFKFVYDKDYHYLTVSASTDYWLVLETDGYTYDTTPGSEKIVRLRVDAGDGAANSFATYDAGGASWSTSNDGANNHAEIHFSQGLQNKVSQCTMYGPTGKVGRALRVEETSQIWMDHCFCACVQALYDEGCYVFMDHVYWFAFAAIPFDLTNGHVWWDSCWNEAANVCQLKGHGEYHFDKCLAGMRIEWDKDARVEIDGTPQLLTRTYDPALISDQWKYRIITAESGRWGSTGGAVGPVADADAVTGKCMQLSGLNHNVSLIIYPAGYKYETYYGELPVGTYKVTVWAKDTNQVASDFSLRSLYRAVPAAWLVDQANLFTLTSEYRPYYMFLRVEESHYTGSNRGERITLLKATGSVNTISVSHLIFEYIGPDGVFQKDMVAYNAEESDGDGKRVSRQLFVGRQSGGELSALADITGSHDGVIDDEKGELNFRLNSGSGGYNLSSVLKLSTTIDSFTDGDTTPSVADGNIFKTANTGATTITDLTGGISGKSVTILFGDVNTTIDFTGTNLEGNRDQNWTPFAGDSMVAAYDGSKWYCVSSNNQMYTYVTAYGAIGDGVVDDSAAVQAANDAVNAAGGGIVYFPIGIYRLSSQVNFSTNVTLLGTGPESVIYIPSGNKRINFAGSITATTTTLTGNATHSDKTINVTDASAFSAGDWIRIRSGAVFNPGVISDGTYLGEMVQIQSIALNVITLETPLVDDYGTADTAAIDKLTVLENVGMRLLKVLGGGSSPQQIGIAFEQCVNVNISDIIVDEMWNCGIYMRDCVDGDVDTSSFINANRPVYGLGAGIQIGQCANGIRITGNYFERCTHAVLIKGEESYGVSRNISIANNSVHSGGVQGAFAFYNTGEEISVSDNNLVNVQLAALGCPRVTLDGNVCRTLETVYTAAIYVRKNTKEILISNNRIDSGCLYLIEFATDARAIDFTVRGNEFKDISSQNATGVHLRMGFAGLVIEGNKFDGFYRVVYIDSDRPGIVDSYDLQIVGNRMVNGTAQGIWSYAEDCNHEGILIADNIIEPGASSFGIVLNDNADGVHKNSGILIANNIVKRGSDGIRLVTYTENYRIEGNIIKNTTKPVNVTLNPAATQLGGSCDKAVVSSALDLSGGASDVVAFIAPSNGQLVMYDITYTEASSADAGVLVRVGRYRDGVALVGSYFDTTTSEQSKNLGYSTRIFTNALTKRDVSAGDVITVGTAGGKTGTGEVIITLHLALNAE